MNARFPYRRAGILTAKGALMNTGIHSLPTIELKNLRTGEQTGGVVGSPHIATFVPLVRLDRFNALAHEDSKVKTT